MTKDELLHIFRSGKILAFWPPREADEGFVLVLTVLQQDQPIVNDPAFIACLKEHQGVIAVHVKLNHTDVCMNPREHESSWHVMQIPWDEDQEIMACPMCSALRTEAAHNPAHKTVHSHIDLSHKKQVT